MEFQHPHNLFWRIVLFPLTLLGIVVAMFARDRPPIPDHAPPPLGGLRRVIAIGQRQQVGPTTITLLSLEMYDGGCLLNVLIAPVMVVRRPESIELALPVIEAHDDVGTHYTWWPRSGDDTLGRFLAQTAPLPPDAATELRITVTEVYRDRPRASERTREAGPWAFVVSLIHEQRDARTDAKNI